MSPLVLRLEAPPGPVAAWWVPAFTEDAGGLIFPVSPGGTEPAEAHERYQAELSLSLFVGPPATRSLLVGLESGRAVSAWCTLVVPWPVGGRLRRQPILRLGRPGVLVPLVQLEAHPNGMSLTFGAAGAPLLPPPSRDRGGPIDQVFADAVDAARRELGGWLARLVARGFRVQLQGAAVEDRRSLAQALGPDVTPDP